MQFDLVEKKWIEEIASRSGLDLVGSYDEVKASDLSIVQRIRMENGNLYFKSSGGISQFEGKLSQSLYSFDPRHTVEVIATHETKPWFIMNELLGIPLRQIKDKKVWKQCLQEYAYLQVKLSKQIDNYLEIGLPDRRMNVLKNEIQTYLNEMCLTGLNEEETKKILSLKSELLQMCDRMEGIVPHSLDHGDLHSANIQWMNNHPVFFDWGDASVTHPFFSTRIFWNSLYDLIDSDLQWQETVEEFRPYYLEPWTEFAPLHELEKLLLISDQLACVYRAIGWHLYINPYRLDKEDSKQRPAQWLNVFLEQRR